MSEQDADQEVLRLHGLKKSYNVGKPTEVEVLHGLDLRLQRSDFAALVGASGSGKSTLLNLIGLLDRPTDGELFLLGEATARHGRRPPHGAARQRDRLRVPVPPPDPGLHRAGERADAAAGGHRQALAASNSTAAAPCWPRSGWRAWSTASPTSSPAASSSAWPWPAR